MVRYQFEIATRADDAELRSILAATPMDGVISLSFRREPSFFDAAIVEGDSALVGIQRLVPSPCQLQRLAPIGLYPIHARGLGHRVLPQPQIALPNQIALQAEPQRAC